MGSVRIRYPSLNTDTLYTVLYYGYPIGIYIYIYILYTNKIYIYIYIYIYIFDEPIR